SEEDLKWLGAALASSGSCGMFHLDGVTPEARRAPTRGLPSMTITRRDLVAAKRSYTDGDEADVIALGSPQLSEHEVREIARRVERTPPRIPVWVFTSRTVRDASLEAGPLTLRRWRRPGDGQDPRSFDGSRRRTARGSNLRVPARERKHGRILRDLWTREARGGAGWNRECLGRGHRRRRGDSGGNPDGGSNRHGGSADGRPDPPRRRPGDRGTPWRAGHARRDRGPTESRSHLDRAPEREGR